MFKYFSRQYLAGVFDSDGSFSVARRHLKRSKVNYTAMIQLTWKKTEKTELFMKVLTETYGGSFRPCKSTNTYKSFSGTSDYLKFCATGEAAEKLALALHPFLYLKRKQATNLLILRKLTKSYKGKNRPDEISSRLSTLYFDNKSINTKNGWKNA